MGLLAQEVVVLLSWWDLVTLGARSSSLLEGETHCTCCFVPSQLLPGTLEVEEGQLSEPLDDKCRRGPLPPTVRNRHLHMGHACVRARRGVCSSHFPYPAPPG